MRTIFQRFRCAVCKMDFGKKPDLVLHLRRTHMFRRFRCAVCAKTFATEEYCAGHLMRHSANNKRFHCRFCPRRFFSNSQRKLHEHSRAHSDDAPRIPCPICGKALRSQRNVKDHLRTHANDQPYGCAQCPKRFSQKYSIRQHLQLHAAQPAGPFRCPHCSARFGKSNALTRHLHLHGVNGAVGSLSGPATALPQQIAASAGLGMPQVCVVTRKPYPGQIAIMCDACGEILPSAYRLKLHRRSVHRRKAQCDVCKAEFADAFRLKLHRHVHSSDALERPLACARCAGRYKYKSDLAEHIRKFHRQRPALFCAQCGATLTTYNLLVSHVVKHRATKPFECQHPDCGARFATRKEVALHRPVHTTEKPFACRLCPGRFRTARSLRKHGLLHERTKDARCDVCDRWFPQRAQLAAHRLSHATDGAVVRFGCATCLRYHGNKQSLKKHIEQMHTNEFGYSCPSCAKHFKSQRSVQDHCARNRHDWNNYRGRSREMEMDLSVRLPFGTTYQCAICSIVSDELKRFVSHVAQEHLHQRIQCDICTVFLDSPAALEQHLQRHATDANPFACDICPVARFPSRRALMRHKILEHSAKPIFKCCVCTRSSTCAYRLRRHIVAVHSVPRPFECHVLQNVGLPR